MHFPQATHLETISVTEGTKRLNWIAFSGQCCEQTEQYLHFEISTTGKGANISSVENSISFAIKNRSGFSISKSAS
jgi:hypothetical protein